MVARRASPVCGALLLGLAWGLGTLDGMAAADKVPAAGGAIEITPLIHSISRATRKRI